MLAHAIASSAAAQTPAPAPPSPAPSDTGTLIVERVVAADPAKSYAVFLPPGHGAGRRWRALVLMDPRGRALVPLERFRPAAASLGYVILSSYDTSSDEPTSGEDTRSAVEAMLNDAADAFALDLRRLTLVGFSGTARVAWGMALGSPELFPALLGFGGGIPPRVLLALTAGQGAGQGAGPAFFGGAGLRDFNYGEMWITDARLAALGVPAALAFFDAGHAWPPEAIATEAVEWLELRAAAEGAARRDATWARSRFERDRAAAADLERAGRRHDAFLRLTRLVRTFEGLDGAIGAALESARADLDRLGRDRGVRRTTARVDEWLRWEAGRNAEAREAWESLDGQRPPDARALARRLRIADLHERARGADTLAAQAAARVLASDRATASFYAPRRLLAAGDTARALTALEVAVAIDPEGRGMCPWVAGFPRAWLERSPGLRARCGTEP